MSGIIGQVRERSGIVNPVGHCLQYDSSFSTSAISTGDNIDSDTSKPLITEGAEMLSLSFTPLLAGSTLEILVNAGMDANEAANMVMALFNTAIHSTDAVATSASRTGGGVNQNITILYNYTTPSTATATWKVRYGGHSGVTKVGQSNSFNYGLTMQYGITIKEIAT